MKEKNKIFLETILENLNSPNQLFLTGGLVRDFLKENITFSPEWLKQHIHLDIDLVCNPIFFNNIKKKYKTNIITDRFFAINFDNISLICLRKEEYFDYKDNTFKFKNIKTTNSLVQDAYRRDFTINAFYVDLFTNQLFDFFNGLKDLNDNTLSLIDSQAFFLDDSRFIRSLCFNFEYKIKLDKKLFLIYNKFVDQLNSIYKCSERFKLKILYLSNKYNINNFFQFIKDSEIFNDYNKLKIIKLFNEFIQNDLQK